MFCLTTASTNPFTLQLFLLLLFIHVLCIAHIFFGAAKKFAFLCFQMQFLCQLHFKVSAFILFAFCWLFFFSLALFFNVVNFATSPIPFGCGINCLQLAQSQPVIASICNAFLHSHLHTDP